MKYGFAKFDAYRIPFLTVVALIVFAVILGGGSRFDIVSLLVLRPFGAICAVYAVVTCWSACWSRYRALGLVVAAMAGLFVAHLLPLPPGVWQSLPGREVAVEAMVAAGLQDRWMPLSMTPDMTWNALFAALLPLAVLLLALALPVIRLAQVWLVVGGLIGVSALVSLLQIVGPEQGPLYFYRLTNVGYPVGLFSNRNHAALFHACLMPLMAMYLSLARQGRVPHQARVGLAIAVAGYLVLLALASGSRIGLMGMLVGIAGAMWVWRGQRQKSVRFGGVNLKLAGIVSIGVVFLASMALVFSRAETIDRLMGLDATDDQRFKFMPVVWDGVSNYWPMGSGIGSFVEVFQVLEPDNMLTPNYVNHAHNDYLEIALTAGLPGLLLGLAAFVLLARATWPLLRSYNDPGYGKDHQVIGRAAAAVIVIMLIGSVTDYPLRTPSLSVIFALAVASIFVTLRLVADNAIGTMSSDR